MNESTQTVCEVGVIKTRIFFDADGNRTCAVDFSKGLVCDFFRSQRFGSHETCLFAPEAGKYSERLERRGPCNKNIVGSPNAGSLIPGKFCPIENS